MTGRTMSVVFYRQCKSGRLDNRTILKSSSPWPSSRRARVRQPLILDKFGIELTDPIMNLSHWRGSPGECVCRQLYLLPSPRQSPLLSKYIFLRKLSSPRKYFYYIKYMKLLKFIYLFIIQFENFIFKLIEF